MTTDTAAVPATRSSVDADHHDSDCRVTDRDGTDRRVVPGRSPVGDVLGRG